MKLIRTKIHGILDYLIGVIILISPWLFGFESGVEMFVTMLGGALFIANSLFTNYEWGLSKKLSMSFHLYIDGVLGCLLALSPWLLGFDSIVYLPQMFMGLGIMAMALFSSSTPYLYLYYSGNYSSYNLRNL